jgi:Zn finger protein HypA/HybF involved in hydrogenase expression
MYNELAKCHPKLTRNQVWCRHCGRTQNIDSGECFRYGWPKCCGYTMTIDSPEEQLKDNK